MKLSRNVTRYIHFILDELLPPVIRDRGFIMRPLIRLALGKKAAYFLNFKEQAHTMSEAEYTRFYEETYGILERETDLNTQCVTAIQQEATGTVLEAGCGNGYLSGKLVEQGLPVTAIDIQISASTKDAHPQVSFVDGAVEKIPFLDNSFDTVVCTHTLEHVRDLPSAIKELRRVAKKKLIVVVPAQRPNRYTFDLHLHFFPYDFSVYQAFGQTDGEVQLSKLHGDWFYTETYS